MIVGMLGEFSLEYFSENLTVVLIYSILKKDVKYIKINEKHTQNEMFLPKKQKETLPSDSSDCDTN